MATNYVQGEVLVIDAAAPATVVSGQVVRLGKIMAIAMKDITSGATGPFGITGVFTVPKVTAGVVAVGEGLMWDASAAKFDDDAATPATGDVSGGGVTAVEVGTSSMTTIKAKFNAIPGTVT